MEDQIVLRIRHISKAFPGVKALDDISFNIERGTVHALVGENGAGKSTLIKVLAGIYVPDEGELLVNGQCVKFRVPRDARNAGISVVHQEIKLAAPLTVTENVFIGQLVYNRMGLVNWRAMRKRAKQLLDELGANIDVNAPVESLTIAKQQIVEIVKAINTECRVLIMDEPSAVLTDNELKILFQIILKLKEKGYTIIYISHRLDEIFSLADRVTVLRDGRHIETMSIGDLTRDKLISLMVGRAMGNEYPKEIITPGKSVLSVQNLTVDGVLEDISFEVMEGEIFGIFGLVGAGRTELARAILSIDRHNSGQVVFRGSQAEWKNFRAAIEAGAGLVPEDRKIQGLCQEFSVKDNISMVAVDKIISGGLVREKLNDQYAREYVEKLHISTAGIGTQVQYLSGGNQQKVVIAKWLMADSNIIFLDEPTRGIDVGAKVEIYNLITDLVKKGKTVIMISSEMPELLGMSDRIMVMHEGRKMGELTRGEATQEKIMSMCT